MKYPILILFISLIFPAFAQQDSIIGKWKTIDDESGKERSVVEIYKAGDKYFGKILQIILEPGEDTDPVCDECEEDDPRYQQKVIGMEIIRDMEYNVSDGKYENGDILDPENGSVYDCKLWIENGKLMVRGYLLFFYRTQTWHPD